MPQKDTLIAGAQYLAVGFEFAATMVAAVVVGFHVDRYLGTAPWLMLLLTVGGMVGAVQRLLWSLKKHSSRE